MKRERLRTLFRIVIRSSWLVKKSGTAGFSFWAGRDIICRSQFREKTQNKRECVEKQRNITESIFTAYIRLNENQLNTKFHSTVCIKTTRKKLKFPLAFSEICAIILGQSFPRPLEGVADIEGCDGHIHYNMAPIRQNQK